MLRIVLIAFFVGVAGLAGLQTYFGDQSFDDFSFSPRRRARTPAATSSASATPSGTPTPAETSPDLSEGEKLLTLAAESLESKDYPKAISGAQQACDFFGKSPQASDKLQEAQELKRRANLALADDKLKQANESLEQRKFRTAQSTAKEAEDLYREHRGPKESLEQAVALQQDAQARLDDARHRRSSPTATPSAGSTPGAQEGSFVARQGKFEISKDKDAMNIQAKDLSLVVSGNGCQVVWKGHLTDLTLSGSNNTISGFEGQVASIVNKGSHNIVTFNSAKIPDITNRDSASTFAACITDESKNIAFACKDIGVSINSGKNKVTLTGNVTDLQVSGSGNDIKVDAKVEKMSVSGANNSVTYSQKLNPSADFRAGGTNNTIKPIN